MRQKSKTGLSEAKNLHIPIYNLYIKSYDLSNRQTFLKGCN